MIIVFNCPHCAAILRMKEQYGGQRGRCPQCHGAITVPAIETDAGMDLIPLEPTAPTSAGHALAETTPPAAAPSFSIESRFRTMATEAAAGAMPPSSTGDSNIGLAPVDDSPLSAKSRPAASAALDPPPRADKSTALKESASKESGPSDSTIGLAPVDDGPTPAVKAPPSPPPPAKSASSEAEDENFGLAPLEDAPHKPAAVAAATKDAGSSSPAATSAAGGAASAPTTDSKADVRITVLCDGCGAKMRVPPTAAGRQLACPRCKKKLRVPEAPDTATPAKTADTRPPQDTPSSSSSNLDMGMLDEMEGAGVAGESAAAPLKAPAAKGKAKGKAKASPIGQSKSNTLLGMPPMVVYVGGVAGLAILIGGLATVYFVTKPAASPTPTPSPPVVAQTPIAGTPAPTPGKAPTPSGQPAVPNGATPPAPGSTPTAPQPGAPTTPPNASPTPSNPANPGGTPAAPGPALPMPMPMPAAPPVVGRVEWRNRIPVVRLTGRFKSERASEFSEDAVAPVELLTVPPLSPRVEPTPEEIPGLLKVAQTINNTQKGIEAQLKQMTDLAATKQAANQWAETTAQGLDQIRKVNRLAGVSLPNKDAALRFDAMANEEGTVLSAQAELERLARVPGAIDVLEAALKEKATREPDSALADTLKQSASQ